MVADASGLTVFDMAAACDAELVHHMLLEYNLKPADALSLAIKHGDTIVAKVRQKKEQTFGTLKYPNPTCQRWPARE